MFGFHFRLFSNKDKRVKVFTWLDFFEDLIFNVVIYVGTYGVVGMLFVIFPVLGYIEAFSFIYS